MDGTDQPSSASLFWLGAFVVAYAVFDLLPVVLTQDLGWHGLRVGDVVDAPLVLLPLAGYVALGRLAGVWGNVKSSLAFAVLLVLFVQGHAIHLAANAIAASDAPASATWATSYFLDEHWGHWELHAAIVLLAVLLVVLDREPLPVSARSQAVLAACALGYGLLLAADAIEGQTVIMMLPASLLLLAIAIVAGRPPRGAGITVLGGFFGAAALVTAAGLVVYGVANRGYPEILSLQV